MTFIDTCVCQCYDDLVCYCDWNKKSTIKFKQFKLFSVISQHKVVKVVVGRTKNYQQPPMATCRKLWF